MNTATTQKFPRSMLPGTFDYGFGMALMVKDVRLFLPEAEDFGIPIEVAKAVGRLWEKALAEHGPRVGLHRTCEDGREARRRADAREEIDGACHERRYLRGLRRPLRAPPAQGRGELHRRRSARRAAAARLFRLGDRQSDSAPSWSTPASTSRSADRRGRTVITPVARGAEGGRRRSRQGRGRHHQPHALRPLRQSRPVPARPLSTCRTRRWTSAPAAACATRSSAFPTRRTMSSRWCASVFAGRVTFHDGVDEIAPGITVHHIGGHAKGLQSVRVKTRRGCVMLASDAVHLYPHHRRGAHVPDHLQSRRSARRLRDAEEAGDRRAITSCRATIRR